MKFVNGLSASHGIITDMEEVFKLLYSSDSTDSLKGTVAKTERKLWNIWIKSTEVFKTHVQIT